MFSASRSHTLNYAFGAGIVMSIGVTEVLGAIAVKGGLIA
jgi:hypothetical protein